VIKANFSSSVSVSHYPSEIILIYWFVAQETFIIIINIEDIFVKPQHFFSSSFDEQKVQLFFPDIFLW